MTLVSDAHADHEARYRDRGGRQVVDHYGKPDRVGKAVRNVVGTIEMGYGVLAVTGEDRVDFVDNAVTNRVPSADGRGVYALLCDPQGGIETDMYVYNADERLLVFVPPERAEPVREDWAAKTFIQDVAIDRGVRGSRPQIDGEGRLGAQRRRRARRPADVRPRVDGRRRRHGDRDRRPPRRGGIRGRLCGRRRPGRVRHPRQPRAQRGSVRLPDVGDAGIGGRDAVVRTRTRGRDTQRRRHPQRPRLREGVLRRPGGGLPRGEPGATERAAGRAHPRRAGSRGSTATPTRRR